MARVPAMPDAFDLLGLPRRPWLDPVEIRRAFQARARILHPDAKAGDADAFSALNQAHSLIASPAGRLRLLLGEVLSAPADAELGFEVATVLRATDQVVARAGSSGNVLSRALMIPEIRESLARVGALLGRVDAMLGSAETRLRELDAGWPDVDAVDLARLAAEFAFLSRWRGQLAERVLSLELALH